MVRQGQDCLDDLLDEPCPHCGELTRRDDRMCDNCGRLVTWSYMNGRPFDPWLLLALGVSLAALMTGLLAAGQWVVTA